MQLPTAGPAVHRVLVIDDEPDVAATLRRVLLLCGVPEVVVCTDSTSVDEALRVHEPDVVLSDLLMPGRSGFEVLESIRRTSPRTLVVVVSAHSTLENAVRAVKAGAFDFLAKPFDPDSVELMLEKLRRELLARAEAEQLRRHIALQDPFLGQLTGASPAMTMLRERVQRLRDVSANVLIEGETGTGKELVARALHGGRGPFVAVNVAAIPADIAESELFGHRAGAFTGASRDRAGLLAEAAGGTLFLDEINAMSLGLQAKLLRAIETRTVRAVGTDRDRPVNFRLVCASNEPLETAVHQGRFRRDLLHRVRVASIRVPPLRERLEDVPLRADEFLQRHARTHGRSLRGFAPDVLEVLRMREWSGNVRELENLVEQLVIFAPEGAACVGMDALEIAAGGTQGTGGPSAASDMRLAAVEARYVRAVLRMTRGNKSQAARLLDIDYKTLLRKMREMDA